MAEVICPENIQIDIHVDRLLDESLKLKKKGLRLSQACAAYVDGRFELSYSFADDSGTYELTTFRIVIDPETEVSSITELYPYAFLYENEMKELFGVKIQMTSPDYENRLYRIRQETPLKVDRPKPAAPAKPTAANAAAAKPAAVSADPAAAPAVPTAEAVSVNPTVAALKAETAPEKGEA